MNVGDPNVTVLNLKGLVPNDDGRVRFLLPGKGKMIGGVEAFGLLSLKSTRQPIQEAPNRARPNAIPDPFRLLMGKPTGHVGLGI
jgi:hypothetical protein